MSDILGNLNDLQKEINKITGVKTIDDYKAENARLRKAGEAMAKKLDFLDDAIAYELSRDHEIGQLVATWREACGE